MAQVTEWLKTHHPELAVRVVGSVVVDEQHLSDDQLLAKAREFHAHAEASKKADADKTGASPQNLSQN
jgi:hypothetical protein